MKKEQRQVGKYLSRAEKVTYYPENSADALEALNSVVDEHISFDDEIKLWESLAKKCLRTSSLPDSPRIYYQEEAPEKWQATFVKGLSAATLERYILTVRKFEHDSPEGLSARILEQIAAMRTGNEALKHAFRLGELTKLVHVYSVTGQPLKKGRTKGATSNKENAASRKKQMLSIDADLREKRPDMSVDARVRYIRREIPKPSGKMYTLRYIKDLIKAQS